MTKEEKAKLPGKIRRGYTCLKIGSVLLMIDVVLSLTGWIISLVSIWAHWEWAPPLDFSTFVDATTNGVQPLIFIFMFLSGIAGFSYVRNKGPFIWMCSWMAIILMIIMVIDWVLAVRDAIVMKDVWQFFLGILSIGLSGILYVIGWFLTKDYLEE